MLQGRANFLMDDPYRKAIYNFMDVPFLSLPLQGKLNQVWQTIRLTFISVSHTPLPDLCCIGPFCLRSFVVGIIDSYEM